jgi:hypothetical protein
MNNIKAETSCSLCRLLAAVRPRESGELSTKDDRDETNYHLRAYPSVKGLKMSVKGPRSELPYNTALAVSAWKIKARSGFGDKSSARKQLYRSIFHGLIVPALQENPAEYPQVDSHEMFGRPV